MFFFEKKPAKPNVAKIVAISVGVTFAVAAAVYGLYIFCRKYCRLCVCDDEFLDDDCDFDCDCEFCNDDDECIACDGENDVD